MKPETKIASLNPDRSVDDQAIGEILVRSGTLKPKDVDQVLRYAAKKKIQFGDAVLKLRLASKGDVEHALARQFDYPYLKPGEGGYGKELVAAYQPFGSQGEQLRRLRMQLMLRWFAKGNNALAIVSAAHDEGRTFLAANLAVVFSQLGSKTLLIDAHLGEARLHKIFSHDNSNGLSQVLVGRSASTQAIRKVPHFENLWFLPAGPRPPNPEELLARNEFDELLAMAGSVYDVILIDTPPGETGTGAEAVAFRCGGALLVTRRNKSAVDDIRSFTARLGTGAEVVGGVLSNF